MASVYPCSGENPWIEILAGDLKRPWRRSLSAKDMRYYSDTKKRLLDKSCPRYAVEYMRLKMMSKQPRRTKIEIPKEQSVLYSTVLSRSWDRTNNSTSTMNPTNLNFNMSGMMSSRDGGERESQHDPSWDRPRFAAYWPHGHTQRLAHHMNPLPFHKLSTQALLDPENNLNNTQSTAFMSNGFNSSTGMISGGFSRPATSMDGLNNSNMCDTGTTAASRTLRSRPATTHNNVITGRNLVQDTPLFILSIYTKLFYFLRSHSILHKTHNYFIKFYTHSYYYFLITTLLHTPTRPLSLPVLL